MHKFTWNLTKNQLKQTVKAAPRTFIVTGASKDNYCEADL